MKYSKSLIFVTVVLKIGVFQIPFLSLISASPTTVPPDFIETTMNPTLQTPTNTNETSVEEQEVPEVPESPEVPVPSVTSSPGGSTLLERVNLDQYLRNKRAMQLQIRCVVYDGKCDIVGKEVKKYIIIGLTGKCSNCSQKMTNAVEKVVSYIQENYPQAWNDAIYRYLVAPVFADKYRGNATTPAANHTMSAA